MTQRTKIIRTQRGYLLTGLDGLTEMEKDTAARMVAETHSHGFRTQVLVEKDGWTVKGFYWGPATLERLHPSWH